jgi:ABC-type transporter Mla subunit MlaD
MATAKVRYGSLTGKKFVILTMGPKEAGSVLASLEAGPGNRNVDNVIDAITDTGAAADYTTTEPTLVAA